MADNNTVARPYAEAVFEVAGNRLIARLAVAVVQFIRVQLELGIKLFGINTNPNQLSWTESPKAYADIYVDDAAFGCPLIRPEGFKRPCVDWETVGPELLERVLRGR